MGGRQSHADPRIWEQGCVKYAPCALRSAHNIITTGGPRVKASKQAGVIKSVGGGVRGGDDVDLSMRFSHDYRVVERKRK